jgi:hypothetical protein
METGHEQRKATPLGDAMSFLIVILGYVVIPLVVRTIGREISIGIEPLRRLPALYRKTITDKKRCSAPSEGQPGV